MGFFITGPINGREADGAFDILSAEQVTITEGNNDKMTITCPLPSLVVEG